MYRYTFTAFRLEQACKEKRKQKKKQINSFYHIAQGEWAREREREKRIGILIVSTAVAVLDPQPYSTHEIAKFVGVYFRSLSVVDNSFT